MENVLDIQDVMDEHRNKGKVLCCATDAIGMARWPTFTISVVSALDYKEQNQRLQERCSAPEASVNKKIQNISIAQEGRLQGGSSKC